ncbi:sensor histidine kinase [Ornithinimicrobium faecis]|uniref:sensor histidine kinase n=1 Tax=Ornithinimicrobium faecis TaxID=2934158 RepID=UPI0021194444|nr:histidine kinase [Ornithinimicrobium sp. HY1745]
MTRWGETWRILLAVLAGAILWVSSWASIDLEGRVGPEWWLFAVDPIIGLLSLVVMHFRRRWPVIVTVVLILMSTVATTAAGTVLIALISLSTWRRWRALALITPLYLATSFVWDFMFRVPGGQSWVTTATNVTFQMLVLIAAISVGYSIGARRDNLAALRERAEVAEREQGRRVEQARATERARIAREMHDVLAHRISLIAMNAGVLSYRQDLPPEQMREIAGTVRDNADQAVQELRTVLGVLRGSDEPDQPRGPQPDLVQLTTLFDEVRAGGTPVVTTLRVDPSSVPETISRHAYRIIQEGLTNARKHAKGQPVTVSLSGGAGVGLDLTIVNQPASYGEEPQHDGVRESGSGMGLLGLAERAVLSGGQLSYGTDRSGRFVVRAWLPWTT